MLDDARWKALIPEIVVGASLGMLVGVLLGLSVAPIVGGIAAALAALLGVFFGLSKASDTTPVTPFYRLRTVCFCIMCIGGIFLGLFTRTHDLFGLSFEDRVKAWERAGASPKDALSYVAFQALGLVPANHTSAPPPTPSAINDVLFASRGSSQCLSLNTDRFKTVEQRLDAMELAGGRWAIFANAVKQTAADQHSIISDAGYQLMCGSDK